MQIQRIALPVLVSTASAMSGELLVSALNRQSHFRVVSRVTTVEQLLDAIQTEPIAVALISLNLANGPLTGLTGFRQVRRLSPSTRSVLLTDSPDRNVVVEAFRSGARGVFCPSHSTFKELCRCVECVSRGQIWASSAELCQVLDAFSEYSPMKVVDSNGLSLLTKREEDVIRLLAEGLQNREIAKELNLSVHTVKNYLFHMFDKLGVSSRVELVLYAISCMERMKAVEHDAATRDIYVQG